MCFLLLGECTLFDIEKFWQHFNDEMRARFNEVAYNAWFKNTKPISYNKNTHELKILVQNPVAKGYWEKNLSSQLIQSAYGYAGMEILPVFQINENNDSLSESLLQNLGMLFNYDKKKEHPSNLLKI